MQKTAIVIPCYNEEKRLDVRAFTDFSASNPNIHFIMVNDGSSDGTGGILKDLSKGHSPFICIDFETNKGKAEAVRQGFIKGFELKYANIGYWDADLATPLSEINLFVDYLAQGEKTMVFGSRIRLLSRPIKRNAVRHYLGRLFATVASLILQITIYDTQCGAKIFQNTKELQMVFSKPFSTRWIFDVEIISRIILLNKYFNSTSLEHTAVEHPLNEWSDIPGSKLTKGDFFKAITELVTIYKFLHMPNWQKRCQKLLI